MLNRRTIVFRLWVALSFVAAVITTSALGVYVWLSISDDIDSARAQTQARIQAVIAIGARYGTLAPDNQNPDQTAAGNLGIERVEVFNADGALLSSAAFTPSTPVPPPLDAAQLELAKTGTATERTIQRFALTYKAEPLSVLDVIRGGKFGEEHVVPLSRIFPTQSGAVRIVADYPALTSGARTLMARSIVAAEVIIAVMIVGMWYFLRHFVARPLQRYSDLAMRIAVGERVRMPASGDDELSQLGRAVNGMADALEHQATVDSLTGLFNLRHLSSHLEALIEEAVQTSEPLSVVFCDLDNLKGVNDTYGHEAGDRMLRAVGEALHAWAGQRGICWRLSTGGDEFVIALPSETGHAVQARTELLRKAVASILVPVADTHIRPSVSVGVSSYPEDGNSAAIMGIADKRMYANKTSKTDERRGLEEHRLTSTPAA